MIIITNQFSRSIQYQTNSEIYTNLRTELEYLYDSDDLDKYLPSPSRLEHILKYYRQKSSIKLTEINMKENLNNYLWEEWMKFTNQTLSMWIFERFIIFAHEKTLKLISSCDYRRLSAGR